MPSTRADAWLEAGAKRLRKCSYPEYFDHLSSRCCQRVEYQVESKKIIKVTATDVVKPQIAELISKDVPRSWSGLQDFDSESSRADLEEVLLCFSVHCPRVGYTQGMSFICAVALTEMEKEWAFWFLTYIVRSLPWNFFYGTVQLEVSLFTSIIDKYAPMIKDQFESDGMEVTANYFLVPCFVPLFVYVLPVSTTLRVWDMIFERAQLGDELILSLHRVAFALLQIHSGVLLSENLTCREAYKKALSEKKGQELLCFYRQKLEETSGVLFIQQVLERVRQDTNADRLIHIASELTIHSDWLLSNRMSMSEDRERTDAAFALQRAYRKHMRKQANLRKLEQLRNCKLRQESKHMIRQERHKVAVESHFQKSMRQTKEKFFTSTFSPEVDKMKQADQCIIS